MLEETKPRNRVILLIALVSIFSGCDVYIAKEPIIDEAHRQFIENIEGTYVEAHGKNAVFVIKEYEKGIYSVFGKRQDVYGKLVNDQQLLTRVHALKGSNNFIIVSGSIIDFFYHNNFFYYKKYYHFYSYKEMEEFDRRIAQAKKESKLEWLLNGQIVLFLKLEGGRLILMEPKLSSLKNPPFSNIINDGVFVGTKEEILRGLLEATQDPHLWGKMHKVFFGDNEYIKIDGNSE